MSDDIGKKVKFSGTLSFVSANPNSNIIVSENGDNVPEIDHAADEAAEENRKLQAAFQEGYDSCMQEMMPQVDKIKDQLMQITQKLPVSISEYFKDLESQAKKETVELAFSIARTILGREIENKDILNTLLDEALMPLMNIRGIKIYLNPGVAEDAKEAAHLAIPAGAQILPDSRLKAGEAMIESSQGLIDATLTGRLQTLKEAYMKILSEQKD